MERHKPRATLLYEFERVCRGDVSLYVWSICCNVTDGGKLATGRKAANGSDEGGHACSPDPLVLSKPQCMVKGGLASEGHK